MKKFFLTLILASLSFCAVSAQKRPPALKQTSLTAKTVAAKGAGRPYVLDLTRAGTVYNLAADVDYSRVQLHTAKGDMTIAEVIKKSGRKVSGKATIGMKTDLHTMRLALRRQGGGLGGGSLNYDCGDFACICSGDDDCNNLFTDDKCGPIAVCYPDSGICICLRF